MALALFLACAWTAYRLMEMAPVHPAIAAAVGMVVLALLVSMQMRLSVAGSPHAFADDKRLAGWIAHPLRGWFYWVLALLLSQPVLMVVYCTWWPQEVVHAAASQDQLEQAQLRERQDALIQQAQAQLRQGREAVQRLDILFQVDTSEPQASTAPAPPAQGRRKALVVGNQRYGSELGVVEGAQKDAELLTEALRLTGFDVTTLLDAKLPKLEDGIQSYLSGLKPGDVSVFYFTGHGFSERGVDYLMPVDFQSGKTATALSLPVAVSALSRKRLAANLIWLDASYQFAHDSALQPGLVLGELGTNTSLVLASAPSKPAPDRKAGQAGLFASALARALRQATFDTSLDALFDRVRTDVASASQGAQQISVSSTLTAPVQLVAPDAPLAVAQRAHAASAQRARDTVEQLAKAWHCQVANNTSTNEQVQAVRECVQAQVALLDDTLHVILRCDPSTSSGDPAAVGAPDPGMCVDQVLATKAGTSASAVALAPRADVGHSGVSGTVPDLHGAIAFLRQFWLNSSLKAAGASLLIAIFFLGPIWARDYKKGEKGQEGPLAEYENQRRYRSQEFLHLRIGELENQLGRQLAAVHAGTHRDVMSWVEALIRPLRGEWKSLPQIALGKDGIAVQRQPAGRR